MARCEDNLPQKVAPPSTIRRLHRCKLSMDQMIAGSCLRLDRRHRQAGASGCCCCCCSSLLGSFVAGNGVVDA